MEKSYFTLVTQDYWTAKNPLQAEAKKLMRSFERKIITAADKPAFVKRIEMAFYDLNKKHPRCKPLQIDQWTPSGDDPIIHISGVTQMVFYSVAEKPLDQLELAIQFLKRRAISTEKVNITLIKQLIAVLSISEVEAVLGMVQSGDFLNFYNKMKEQGCEACM